MFKCALNAQIVKFRLYRTGSPLQKGFQFARLFTFTIGTDFLYTFQLSLKKKNCRKELALSNLVIAAMNRFSLGIKRDERNLQ